MDVALDVAHGAAATDNFTACHKLAGKNRAEEVDLQFNGCQRFAFFETAAPRSAHGGIGSIAKHAAVQCSHRVGVLRAGLELDPRVVALEVDQTETDQTRNRGWRPFEPPVEIG